VLVISVIFFGNHTWSAKAQSIDNCRIGASKWNIVSLGFPLRAERLANLSTANILVLPYQLKDEPNYSITEGDKSVFENAAKDIASLSGGKLKLNLIYNPTVELALSAVDLDEIKKGQQINWQKDFEKSTYGFTTRVLKENDKTINFKGIDAVVLFGKSINKRQVIAEAFMFTRDQHQLSTVKNGLGGNWFDPIKTDEGDISNAVLLYNSLSFGLSDRTLTHELMHVVGLTDLYGSENSPPLSLMASFTLSILPYEQFVLGWLPESNVTCVNQSTEISQNSVQNTFTLDYSKGSHSLIIPTSINTALIIDVLKSESSVSLLYYSLSNDKRPPIETFQSQSNGSKSVDLSNLGGISSQLISPEYSLLVNNNDGSKVTVSLIPTPKINTPDSTQLIENSKKRKIEVEAELVAKVLAERQANSDAGLKAAAELKAKQEAEAKAAAELKAKQDADAKAAAELKAKQEADAKAAAELKAKQEAEAKAAAELKAKQEAEAKAAAELKAKQEAEAKAAAELKAKQEAAAKLAATKKATITCVKGKLSKKITAIKPRCPAGYKVKK